MAGYPPHRWRGYHGGYQPPDEAFLPGIPNFFDPGFAAPPMMMPMPPPDPYGGFGMGGPPPPPFGPGGDDFDDAGPGPPPGGPFDPYGGGFYGPWMGGGFPGGWGRGFWPGGDGGGGDDGDAAAADDDDDLPKTTYRSSGHVRRGIRMVHNPKQTRLHIFKKTDLLDAAGWKDGTKKARRLSVGSFSIWEADPNWTVAQLMDYLGKGDDKWAVTELSEAGNGRWYKGSTFKYADERAKETLSKQGWTERRGKPNGQSPVWLAMHKAE
ncbi:hypothetical protein GTA08_BOTSDO10942 [Neofusicoccum parvum]|uniref:Uncharacterized protein n=1 Tax=Neofusicoccum parvum TaxID=310453 RepID=A0ACB5SIN3_9PEZI|nr:hypothetical protein GTA08_BOTSDO10942 [Neofusicoccum parvum]